MSPSLWACFVSYPVPPSLARKTMPYKGILSEKQLLPQTLSPTCHRCPVDQGLAGGCPRGCVHVTAKTSTQRRHAFSCMYLHVPKICITRRVGHTVRPMIAPEDVDHESPTMLRDKKRGGYSASGQENLRFLVQLMHIHGPLNQRGSCNQRPPGVSSLKYISFHPFSWSIDLNFLWHSIGR